MKRVFYVLLFISCCLCGCSSGYSDGGMYMFEQQGGSTSNTIHGTVDMQSSAICNYLCAYLENAYLIDAERDMDGSTPGVILRYKNAEYTFYLYMEQETDAVSVIRSTDAQSIGRFSLNDFESSEDMVRFIADAVMQAVKDAADAEQVDEKALSLADVINQSNYAEVNIGDFVQMEVPFTGGEYVSWTSSDSGVVTVSETGLVSAIGQGSAVVTCSIGGMSSGQGFVVMDTTLKGIRLSAESLEMKKNEHKLLEVSYIPSGTTNKKKVTWQSSDKEVATVQNGAIKAVGYGSAVITATCGDYTAKCNVTVVNPLRGIYVSCIKSDTIVGTKIKLDVFYKPEDTTSDKTVSWLSSDHTVATVDSDGLVTANTPGSAVITAKVGDLSADYEISVHVVRMVPDRMECTAGETIPIKVQKQDSAVVQWDSSDPTIATIDDTGLLTAVATGNVTVTATVGNETVRCEVVVSDSAEKPEERQPVEPSVEVQMLTNAKRSKNRGAGGA